jgi:hypothetical protein
MPRIFPFASPLGLPVLAATLLTSLAGPTMAADVFTAGTGGTHTSLQGAIDACPTTGCTIQLLDSVYQLPREVWIENKRNLAIERSAALRQAGIRPRLVGNPITQFQVAGTAANPSDPLRPAGWKRWPVHCKDSVGGSLNAKNPYSTNGYQYNGLLVVVSSQDIRLEGLDLDGQNPAVFVNKGIWNCMYDVLFGNVGINLFHSARVVVRDTEIRNFFTGFYIKNRNPGGAVASPNPNDLADQAVEPYSRYGAMGDHLIERNEIHHNWWAVYDEMEWDLGSTFRFNRIASNFNPFYGSEPVESSELDNMAGGFLFVKDVTQAIHRIHNNVIWGSPLIIGHGGYKAGNQHLFYNNIVGGFDLILTKPWLKNMLRDFRQTFSGYGYWLDHNLFEIRDSSATVMKTAFNAIQVRDSATCAAHGQSSPCFLQLDEPTSIRSVFLWPWNGWRVAGGGIIRGKVGGKLVESTNPQASELFPGGGRIQFLMPNTTQLDVLASNNHWAFELPLKSRVQGTAGFLEPDWNDSLVLHTVRGQGSLVSGWTNAGGRTDRGAILSDGSTPRDLGPQEPGAGLEGRSQLLCGPTAHPVWRRFRSRTLGLRRSLVRPFPGGELWHHARSETAEAQGPPGFELRRRTVEDVLPGFHPLPERGPPVPCHLVSDHPRPASPSPKPPITCWPNPVWISSSGPTRLAGSRWRCAPRGCAEDWSCVGWAVRRPR